VITARIAESATTAAVFAGLLVPRAAPM